MPCLDVDFLLQLSPVGDECQALDIDSVDIAGMAACFWEPMSFSLLSAPVSACWMKVDVSGHGSPASLAEVRRIHISSHDGFLLPVASATFYGVDWASTTITSLKALEGVQVAYVWNGDTSLDTGVFMTGMHTSLTHSDGSRVLVSCAQRLGEYKERLGKDVADQKVTTLDWAVRALHKQVDVYFYGITYDGESFPLLMSVCANSDPFTFDFAPDTDFLIDMLCNVL